MPPHPPTLACLCVQIRHPYNPPFKILGYKPPYLEVHNLNGKSKNKYIHELSDLIRHTALEVHFCTCPVEQTRACRNTILDSWIVETGLYTMLVFTFQNGVLGNKAMAGILLV